MPRDRKRLLGYVETIQIILGVTDKRPFLYCVVILTDNSCGPGQFHCDNRRCIGSQKVCDTHDDCHDGSDEKDCRKLKN